MIQLENIIFSFIHKVNTRWNAYDPKNLCDNFALLNRNQDGIQVYKCQGHPHQCVTNYIKFPQDFFLSLSFSQCQVNVTPGLVALRSKANNKYICADSNGSKPLIANRDAAAGWETFELVVINGDNVALKSKTNNLYISIGDDGKNILETFYNDKNEHNILLLG